MMANGTDDARVVTKASIAGHATVPVRRVNHITENIANNAPNAPQSVERKAWNQGGLWSRRIDSPHSTLVRKAAMTGAIRKLNNTNNGVGNAFTFHLTIALHSYSSAACGTKSLFENGWFTTMFA